MKVLKQAFEKGKGNRSPVCLVASSQTWHQQICGRAYVRRLTWASGFRKGRVVTDMPVFLGSDPDDGGFVGPVFDLVTILPRVRLAVI